MADAHTTEPAKRKPNKNERVFYSVVAAGLIWSFVFALYMALFVRPNLSHAESHQNLIELLVTLVAVSGVTIPLCVAYLTLGKGGDVFITVAEHLPLMLDTRGHPLTVVHQAYLYWQERERQNAGALSRALKTIYAFTRQLVWPTSHLIDHDAKLAILSDDLAKKFSFYIENDEDQRGMMRYVWTTGISGILCFAAATLIYMRLDFNAVVFADDVLLFYTFLANIATYAYLIRLIYLKASLRREALHQAGLFCNDIKNDVIAAVTDAERQKKTTGQELDADAANIPSKT